jgi:hypothetical protein
MKWRAACLQEMGGGGELFVYPRLRNGNINFISTEVPRVRMEVKFQVQNFPFVFFLLALLY